VHSHNTWHTKPIQRYTLTVLSSALEFILSRRFLQATGHVTDVWACMHDCADARLQ
jgi:hypothetical protein